MGKLAAIAVALAALPGCNAVFGLDAVVAHDAGSVDGDGDAAPAIDADRTDAGPAGCAEPGGTPDEDGDGRRDACDNCPHYAQVDQLDNDGDGVGNICDPHSTTADRLVAFYGFATGGVPAELRSFSTSGTADWSVSGGQLRLRGALLSNDYLMRLDVGLRDVTVDIAVTVVAPLPTPVPSTSRGVGVWADIDPTGANPQFPTGVVMENAEQTPAAGASVQFAHLVGVHTTDVSRSTTNKPELFAAGTRYTFRLSCRSGAPAACDGFIAYPGAGYGLTMSPATTRVGSVGLRSYGVDADFEYIVVYGPP